MAEDLQNLVDSVGRRLQRAVAIDNPRMRLLSHSSHYGVSDDVRLTSVLERQSPAAAVSWGLDHGIATAEGPVHIPANAELGMRERVCIPIRWKGLLLGYLWLIESEPPLAPEELDIAVRAAEEAAVILYRDQLLNELARSREGGLVRDLLADDVSVRGHAAEELMDADLFVRGPSAVLVAQLFPVADAATDDAVRLGLGSAVEHTRRALAARHSLGLVRHDHALLLVSMRDPTLTTGNLHELAQVLHTAAVKRVDPGGKEWTILVGISDPMAALDDAWRGYRQAKLAIRAARLARTFGPAVAWSDLGIYRLISQVPRDELVQDALHPGLRRLLERRDEREDDRLIDTLEAYLDCAGDVRAAAEQLFVHRATLYYRLNRIEEIAGVELRNGHDRLALHLGLKLMRLAESPS